MATQSSYSRKCIVCVLLDDACNGGEVGGVCAGLFYGIPNKGAFGIFLNEV